MNFAEGTLNLFTSLCVPVQGQCCTVGCQGCCEQGSSGSLQCPHGADPAAPGASRAPSLQPRVSLHQRESQHGEWNLAPGSTAKSSCWRGSLQGRGSESRGANQLILLCCEGEVRLREVPMLAGRSGSHVGQLQQEPAGTALSEAVPVFGIHGHTGQVWAKQWQARKGLQGTFLVPLNSFWYFSRIKQTQLTSTK